MRPIFTIHAGEFVFGETLEKRVPDAELWIPAKDKGIDFLVTQPNRDRPVSVQVKMSRDYRPNHAATAFEKIQIAGGWFTFNREKLKNSPADFWTLILISRDRRTGPFFITIPPSDLLRRLESTFGVRKTYQSYPWVLRRKGVPKKAYCIEGRDLKKADKDNLAQGHTVAQPERDLTKFFDDWSMFK